MPRITSLEGVIYSDEIKFSHRTSIEIVYNKPIIFLSLQWRDGKTTIAIDKDEFRKILSSFLNLEKLLEDKEYSRKV